MAERAKLISGKCVSFPRYLLIELTPFNGASRTWAPLAFMTGYTIFGRKHLRLIPMLFSDI